MLYLRCPECETEFHINVDLHDDFTVECPNCKYCESGCDNYLQSFIEIPTSF